MYQSREEVCSLFPERGRDNYTGGRSSNREKRQRVSGSPNRGYSQTTNEGVDQREIGVEGSDDSCGTKPVLPRRGECHALSAVRGRNEERVAVRARRQERQEVTRRTRLLRSRATKVVVRATLTALFATMLRLLGETGVCLDSRL